MERDALIAHGSSFLLQDRLMNCSDYSTAWVCRTCGSLISLGYEDISLGETALGSSATLETTGPGGEYCRICRADANEKDERKREARSGVRLAIPLQTYLGSMAKGGDLDVVALPYVFRYLCAELACMGIAVSLEIH
jgi:DNA-directed RNA polymerase I subunit RPA2